MTYNLNLVYLLVDPFCHWIFHNWVVVSNIFYFHPYLGKIPILTSIFFKWGWFNHQPDKVFQLLPGLAKMSQSGTEVASLSVSIIEGAGSFLKKKTWWDII